MSKVELQPGRIISTIAKVVGAGLAVGYLIDMAVTALHHCDLTHGSLNLGPGIKKTIGFITRIYSPNPEDWAGVHRIHHSFPDATIYPFYKIGQAIEHAE